MNITEYHAKDKREVGKKGSSKPTGSKNKPEGDEEDEEMEDNEKEEEEEE